MKLNFFLLTAVILLAGSVVAAQESGIKGKVYDSQGALIPGLGILIVDSRGSKVKLETDSNGEYSVQLSTGIYSMKFGDDGRGQWCPVRIENYWVVADGAKMMLDVIVPQGMASHAASNCRERITKYPFTLKKGNIY